jgi:hypothetical protein
MADLGVGVRPLRQLLMRNKRIFISVLKGLTPKPIPSLPKSRTL